MKDRFRITKLLLTTVMMLMLVIGCSSGGSDSDDGTQNATVLAIGVSGSSVKSDDSNSVTVTASVLDGDNAAIEGMTVQFTTDRGALSSASAVTDESGAAEVSFRSGVVDQSNHIATITATLGSLTAQVPVQIVGTTVTVSQESTTLSSGNAISELEIYVTDAGGDGIYNAEVTITTDASSTGSVSLSSSTGTTGVDGTLGIIVTGVSSGTVTLNISAAGAMTSCDYTVEITGNIMQITKPAISPTGLAIGDTLQIVVSDPARGRVVLSTTLGTLNGSGAAVTLDASSGTASAWLRTSTAGFATIQAYNIDAPDVTDSVSVAMYAKAIEADKIVIQASSTVVALSTTELKNSIELKAWVTDDGGNPVGEAPIVFSMTNTPGGGEKLAPANDFTDDFGYAYTNFTSGSLSTSGSGLTITAELLSDSSINDSITIIIGGTSGSVSISESTIVTSINEDTAYQMPISVIVSDSNGNPVPGAVVTMNLWPKYYYLGDCVYDGGVCYGPFPNEDDSFPGTVYYRNQVLDDGEDANGNGQLTPAISSAGTMPATVTADENGLGTFYWVYGKSYARYVRAEVKASTTVLGSETSSTVMITLRPLKDDVEDEVLPGISPFED
jgi:hypothetical protein